MAPRTRPFDGDGAHAGEAAALAGGGGVYLPERDLEVTAAMPAGAAATTFTAGEPYTGPEALEI